MPAEQKFERLVYRKDDLGHRWLGGAGWSRQTSARAGFSGSNPPDAFDICLIVSGQVDFMVERELFSLAGGDLFISRPLERHGSRHMVLQPCELFWFQVLLNGRLPVSKDEAAICRRELSRRNPRVFASTPDIRRDFKRLIDECRERKVLWRDRVKHLALGLIADIIRARRSVPPPRSVSPEIQFAQTWMRRNVAEDYSLRQLAARIGYCGPHFQARFKEETGVAPGLFRTHLRIDEAKRRLIQGASVTKIAYGLGFSSSQYFATAFKRMVGLTPRQYALLSTRQK